MPAFPKPCFIVTFPPSASVLFSIAIVFFHLKLTLLVPNLAEPIGPAIGQVIRYFLQPTILVPALRGTRNAVFNNLLAPQLALVVLPLRAVWNTFFVCMQAAELIGLAINLLLAIFSAFSI